MSVRFLMPEFLRSNAIAGLSALTLWMLIDVVYVFFVRQSSLFLRISWPVILLVAVVAIFYANWRLSSGSTMSRLVKAFLLSLLPFATWLVISTVILLWFHPMIGGRE